MFSVDEQVFAPVDEDDRVTQMTVKAGHEEIVGERGSAAKLLAALQTTGIVGERPAEASEELAERMSGRGRGLRPERAQPRVFDGAAVAARVAQRQVKRSRRVRGATAGLKPRGTGRALLRSQMLRSR